LATSLQSATAPLSGVAGSPIRDRIRFVLEHYLSPDRGGLNAEHPCSVALRDIAALIGTHLGARGQHTDVAASSSAGIGQWAGVPWVGLSVDEDADNSPEPIAVDLLFRGDMSGVYLTLTLRNATKKKGPPNQAQGRLATVAEPLEAHEFTVGGQPDLRTGTPTGLAYQKGTLAHKLYPSESVPSDAELLADLDAALDSYAAYRQVGDPFRRNDATTARLVFGELYANASSRHAVLQLLGESVRVAHAASPGGWEITLDPTFVRMNIGNVLVLDLRCGTVRLNLAADVLPTDIRPALDALPGTDGPGTFKSEPSAMLVTLPVDQLDILHSKVEEAHHELLRRISRRWSFNPLRRFHSSGVLAYLRAEGISVPDPAYAREDPPSPVRLVGGGDRAPTLGMDVRIIQASLAAQGLSYTPWQIAAYITGLQTKGFTIVSGISGTGKTKLAQHFAAMLPQPQTKRVQSDDLPLITVKPYMRDYHRVIIPKAISAHMDVPAPGKKRKVEIEIAGTRHRCTLGHRQQNQTSMYVYIIFAGPIPNRFNELFQPGDRFAIEPRIDNNGEMAGLRLIPEAELAALRPDRATQERNLLFLTVRPDWRDSKSLLGYFNPISEAYQWTPFLRFLLRASESYRARDGLAWFVVFDEMNLAHVEYYFAELLSILESGRSSDGWTTEALTIGYPDDADGELPPREIRLPPNLYFVGTVNIDETTHAFSPKVLDRAFSLAFHDVDFASYPANGIRSTGAVVLQDERDLLAAFTRGGRFATIDKADVLAAVKDRPELRDWLQSLNDRLHPFGLHFGYRVFDEVAAFVAAAGESKLFDAIEGTWPALDAAVLMKVLPKFHGSPTKLERPLREMLAWCTDPKASGIAAGPLFHGVEGSTAGVAPGVVPALPRTAAQLTLMLRDLASDGFAAYG
jgi:hypothetical protein